MKGSIIALFLTFSLNSFTSEDISSCSPELKENTLCRTGLADIKPTQFSIGFFPAKKKAKKFTKAYVENSLHSILRAKLLPVVIGPDQKYYILDGHHTTHGLLNAKIPADKKVLFLKVYKNCSQCSYLEFEKFMTKNGHSFLYDKEYVKRSFYQLPQTISALADDPYRSLSWLVRKEGCFQKVKVNFLEFIWGKVIKDEFKVLGRKIKKSSKKLKKHIKKACEVVKKAKYANLPGYVGN